MFVKRKITIIIIVTRCLRRLKVKLLILYFILSCKSVFNTLLQFFYNFSVSNFFFITKSLTGVKEQITNQKAFFHKN